MKRKKRKLYIAEKIFIIFLILSWMETVEISIENFISFYVLVASIYTFDRLLDALTTLWF